MKKLNNQLIGNIGLFYVCYELSKRGWNCLPTTRNAKGVDIVIYDQKGEKKFTIQVKTLSKGNTPVPFGSELELIADFVIICSDVFSDKPKIYILTPEEVKNKIHHRVKNNKSSYWLQPKNYLGFENNWEKIGEGF